MQTFLFNKIIRDKIYHKLLKEGVIVRKKPLDQRALTSKLKEKLIEEAEEVIEATEQKALIEELADVLEVIHALAEKNSITLQQLDEARNAKRASKGGFQEGIYITTITLDQTHPMLDYFSARPKKYPQVS